jgi:WD40 repeat protein
MGRISFRFPSSGPLAFSPDGETVATATIVVTTSSVKTGKRLHVMEGHEDYVTQVRFSPDGKILASASRDRSIILWNVSSGARLRKIEGQTGEVYYIEFSPDGKWLASLSEDRGIKIMPHGERHSTGIDDQPIRVWDVATGRQVSAIEATNVYGLAFSPDSKQVWSIDGYDSTVQAWEADTGKKIYPKPSRWDVFGSLGRRLFSPTFDAAAFSPDSRVFLGNSIQNVPEGKNVRNFQLSAGRLRAAEFSRDGKFIALTSDKAVQVFNAESGNLIHEMKDATESHDFLMARFSPDGKTLAVGNESIYRLVDSATARELHPGGHTRAPTGGAFSPDGMFLATVTRKGDIKLWEVGSGREIRQFDQGAVWVKSVIFSRDGKTLYTDGVGEVLQIFEVATGKLKKVLAAKGAPGVIDGIALSPDGNILAAADAYHRIVRLWDVTSGSLVRELVTQRWSNARLALAFTPDGNNIVSASDDGTLQVWDSRSGAKARVLGKRTRESVGIYIAPDATRLVSVEEDGTLRILNFADGSQIREIRLEPRGGYGKPTVVSPDGKRVAWAAEDGAIYVQALAGSMPFQLAVYPGISDLAFSQNGTRLVSLSSDMNAVVWDLPNLP